MQFEYTDPQTEIERLFGGFFCINAVGTVDPGDDAKFLNFLRRAKPPPRTTVYIDSSGGNVESAIAIGRIIRDSWFETSVGTYIVNRDAPRELIYPRELLRGRCFSAATLIFIGGRLRYLQDDSKFGVHQFSFKNPDPRNLAHSQIWSAKIATYVSDMGVTPHFLELSASVPSDELKIIDKGRLEDLRIITGGITDVTWSIQARGGGIYLKGERDSIFGHHKVLFGAGKEEGFFFIGIIESLGRERELTSFALVEIVVNDEDIRIDISKRCDRTVNNIYVNISTSLSREEAIIISGSKSFGVQVRANPEAEIFLGISAVSTLGAEDQLKSIFNIFS